MTKTTLERYSLGLGIVNRIGNLITLGGVILAIGTVGTSDLEAELGVIFYSHRYYFLMVLAGMLLTIGGLCLSSAVKSIYRRMCREYRLQKVRSSKVQEEA